MNRTKAISAAQKAFDYIKDQLEKGQWSLGECLPSAKNLAASAGVSFRTMIRAIALLKSKGLVSSIERGHIRAGSGLSAKFLSDQSKTAAWRLKRVAIEKDILSGLYAQQGKLPSCKELQTQYGTCFRTMRKILRSMADDGVVQLRGKAYRLREISTRAFNCRVVFIKYRQLAPPHSAINQAQHQIVEFFERECMYRKVVLEIIEIDFYNSLETRRAISTIAADKQVLGYILDLLWYQGDSFRRAHIDLLSRLSSEKRPVAILDELGDFSLPQEFVHNPLFQVFGIEGKRAGAKVARYLLDLGHRSIAYISTMHSAGYSQRRLVGVTEQFTKAGLSDNVLAIVNDTMEFTFAQAIAIAGFDEKMIRKISSVAATQSQAESLFNELMHYKTITASRTISLSDAKYFRDNLAGLIDLTKRNLSREYFVPMCNAAIIETGNRLMQIGLVPFLTQALTHTNITAWVCSNDFHALAALKFLRNHDIAVPQKISLVGFDNEPAQATEQRLTTYDFNALGFVHAILNFIARPKRPHGSYLHIPIEIEGMIIQRGTTAPRKH